MGDPRSYESTAHVQDLTQHGYNNDLDNSNSSRIQVLLTKARPFAQLRDERIRPFGL